jgi:hypothetical protein
VENGRKNEINPLAQYALESPLIYEKNDDFIAAAASEPEASEQGSRS